MTKETLKIMVATLRVFVAGAQKGNAVTIHAHEVTNQVCRELHRRKEKEKKNTHGFVVTALRALKGGRVLFEAEDSWADDKLNRPKTVEFKRVFGLTDVALEYVARKRREGESVLRESFLMDMMRSFGLLPKLEPAVVREDRPEALIAAVTEIETNYEEEEVMQNTKAVVNNNAARIASEVRNIGVVCRDKSPERLLGALRQVSAFDADSATVAEVIGWDPHTIKPCRDSIRHLNLIGVKQVMTVNLPGAGQHERSRGIFLTPLGRQVAEAGGFEDHVSPEQRWSRYTHRKKNGDMLKNSKKPAASGGGGISLTLPDGSVISNLTVQEAVELQRAFGSAPTSGEMPVAAGGGQAPVAVAAPPKTLGTYRTIGVMLSAVTNAICSTVEKLQTIENSEAVNIDGVSCSLTEIEHVITGLKHYVNRCLRGEVEFDLKGLQDYAAQMDLDVERIERQREIPVLGDIDKEVGFGRVLRGEKSIKKVVWTP
jgi:hypothetical protein